MVIHPREVLGDLADYKPDNREWRLSHIGHRIATTAALVASVAVIGGVCWLLADQWLGVIVGCFVGCNLAVLLMGLLQSSSDN